MMSHATPATRMLDAAGIAWQLRTYPYETVDAHLAMHAAAAIGVEPAQVFKTLLLAADDRAACAVLPADHELDLKAFARVLGAKRATLLPRTEAERISGYHVGGISPFGRRKATPVVLDASARDLERLWCNGGQRGLMIEVSPAALVRVLGARMAAIARPD